MLVLIGITAWVVDFGMLMLSRNQVQNAADAGALAGATSLAFDSFTDRSTTGPARVAGQRFAQMNNVFSATPDVNIDTDVTFVPCPDDPDPPPIAETPCIRVDAYRNQARNNPIPMVFGRAVGLTAAGRTRHGDSDRGRCQCARNCLRPWAIGRSLVGDAGEQILALPRTRSIRPKAIITRLEMQAQGPATRSRNYGVQLTIINRRRTDKVGTSSRRDGFSPSISRAWIRPTGVRTRITPISRACGGYPSTYAGPRYSLSR